MACAISAPSNPGGKAIMDCLLDHQQEMSEGCYQALKAKLGR
jgi:hypothetical protein